ncbi:MAG: Uma2 family endonuclease [Bacteroidota bacterium]
MNAAIIKNDTDYTFEEYLAFEEQALERYEYHNGKIVAMAGGTGNHGAIANRMGTLLENEIDRSNENCIVFNSDVKVWIEKYNKAVYPDASMGCDSIRYEDENKMVLSNPLLLVEVLSKSTSAYDKSEKFEMYRSIPSFKEYVIVYQTIPRVQAWYKEAQGLWRISHALGLESSIRIHTLDCAIPLRAIYKRILKDLQDIPVDLSETY